MIIPQPINHIVKPDTSGDIVQLFFENDQSREFYMRGAIGWLEGKKPGFALLAGQTLDTKEVWLFDEFEFMTVDHWLNEDQTLKQEGLSSFLLKCWSKYGCRTFFYNQDIEIHRRYYFQILDSIMIDPKPEFLRTPYTTDEKIRDNIVDEYLALGKLKGNKHSRVYEYMKSHAYDEPMGLHCIRCLLGGFEAFPWIER